MRVEKATWRRRDNSSERLKAFREGTLYAADFVCICCHQTQFQTNVIHFRNVLQNPKKTLVIQRRLFKSLLQGILFRLIFFLPLLKSFLNGFLLSIFFLSYDGCVLSLGHHSVPVMLGLLQKFVCSMYHLGFAPPI